ncbi:MarR family winged helix-turn-helix transcriptional regulator [Sanguibacter inulinus]|nr:MarR family winged helix-turn-helix transcriptional regulator [Sanguibacter inulinus]
MTTTEVVRSPGRAAAGSSVEGQAVAGRTAAGSSVESQAVAGSSMAGSSPATRPSVDGRLAAASWEALFRAQVALMRRFSADDIWHPVSMREYDVLFTLTSAPAGLRLNELNREVLVTQPSLSRMVERLESKGLVTRCAAEGDRRGTLIRLTDEGAALQKEIGRRHVRSIRKYLEPALDEQQLTMLLELCTTLRTAQDSIPD